MDEQVVGMIRDKLKAGTPELELENALRAAGYSANEIRDVFEAASGAPRRSNMPLFIILALFLAMAGAAYWFLSQTAAPAQQAGTALFSVKDVGGVGLNGASLLVLDKDNKVLFNSTVSGNKSLALSGNGPYTYVLKCPAGYVGAMGGTKDAGELRSVSLTCERAAANATANVTKPPEPSQNVTQPQPNVTSTNATASITVNVLDVKGANVSGASVRLFSGAKLLNTITTVNGTASVPNQSLGNYTVNASCPASYTGSFATNITLSQNASLNFTCDFANFTLSLRIAAGGGGVANYTVSLTHYVDGRKMVLTNTTDSGGTAKFWVYPKGYYVDSQCGAGYAPITSRLIVVNASSPSVTLACESLQYTVNAWLKDAMGNSIAGTIKALNSSGYAYLTKAITVQNQFIAMNLSEGTTYVKGESSGLACDPVKEEITYSMLYSGAGGDITLTCVAAANINVTAVTAFGAYQGGSQGAKITATNVYGASSTFTTGTGGNVTFQLPNTGNPWKFSAACSNATSPETYEYDLAAGNAYAPTFTVQQSICS